MTKTTLIIFCVFIFLGAWAADQTYKEPLITYDLSSTHVLVNWFDTVEERALAVENDTVEGLSECEYRPDFNTSFCELWLVRPTSENDAFNYDTIGHEFYHALVGDFHD